MSEWLYEAGIGEARAARVEDGRIVEAAIELTDTLTVGTVATGRLVELLPGRQGRVTLTQGGDVLLAPVPKGMTQGSALTVIVTREAIPNGVAQSSQKPRSRPKMRHPPPAPISSPASLPPACPCANCSPINRTIWKQPAGPNCSTKR